VTDERGQALPAAGLARWLGAVAPARALGLVGVALVSDARARALNRRYRGRDYAPDVLSFSGGASESGPPTIPSRRPPPDLGDIVIARGVARRQARAAGHAERVELRAPTSPFRRSSSTPRRRERPRARRST
jgi:rRNA maturation RNase YbeY